MIKENPSPPSKPNEVVQSKDDEVKTKKKHYLPKEVVKEHLDYLRNKYPNCFTIPPSPLALKIHLELRERENGKMSNNLINRLLAAYTNSKEYTKILKTGPNRLDLEGNIVSEIT